ncbi:HmuY family protein [Bacteroides fragilis]|nr:HmuY family protein [Bacteroides fragilis]MCE8680505.1 HmuY family protein [Bacteroides fragilis]
MKIHSLLMNFTLLGTILVSFSACNGILSNIYDEPETAKDFGFIAIDRANHSGTVRVDATQYTKWNYINLHTLRIDSAKITSEGAEDPAAWDLAIHRYDVKTNGGEVLETDFQSLNALKNADSMPQGTFVADEWTTNKIAIDVSHMMEDDGYLIYALSDYNPELSKWLDVDTREMPPIYTPSNKVYLLRMEDGTMAAIRLTSYMNAKGAKGYMTFDYLYPYEP